MVKREWTLYAASTIKSLVHMIYGCIDMDHYNALHARATEMLNDVWHSVYDASMAMPHPEHEWEVFWEDVVLEVQASDMGIRLCDVFYGEKWNPPGDKGKVRISLIPYPNHVLTIDLKLKGTMDRHVADMIYEKVEA